MSKQIYLDTFNSHILDFLNDILLIFPNDNDIKYGKTYVNTITYVTKSYILKLWYYYSSKYKDQIEKGDVSFFLKKNYDNDILDELAKLHSNNITIHYVMGNHDYWDFGFFKKKFGAHIHKKDLLLKSEKYNMLVTHGDGILKHDSKYRFMRKIIRSNLFILLVRLIPISIMTIIAQKISNTKKKFDQDQYLDVQYKNELSKFAFKNMKDKNINVVLMGHYHQTGIYEKNNQKFIHLGDWINQYTVTILDKQWVWKQKIWDINK